jgi:hypothetical protein
VLTKSSDWERDLQKFWQLRIYIAKDRYKVLSKELIKLGNEEAKSKLKKKLAID